MGELTERDKDVAEWIKSDLERRSKFPADMGFYPFSNKFAENVELKAPWLPEYYSFRQINKQATGTELLQYLEQRGADGTVLMDRYRGALLGLMLGDALGMPLEFRSRDSLTVSGLVGGGPFNLEPGYWTDDTSMACCLAYSLIKCKGFDARHQMECYSYWYRYGAYSSTGSCFDIGITTRRAIEQYLASGNPYAGSTDPSTAGNGSLMRLAPVVLFYFDDFEKVVHYAAKSSMTTHQAVEAVDACRYFAALLYGALAGVKKDALLDGIYSPIPGYWQTRPLAPAIQNIALGSYKRKSRDQISSSGYVVHTLEAALWAFNRNNDFRSGLLEAVNLGDDSDTVGAVCGQLSGAFYGETGIPIDWIRHTYATHGGYHFAQDLMAAKNDTPPSVSVDGL
jgi:ADP-ribosyl-[dinitrogen reductase] hydrolase